MSNILNIINERIAERGLTQSDVAHAIDMHAGNLNRLLSGQRRSEGTVRNQVEILEEIFDVLELEVRAKNSENIS